MVKKQEKSILTFRKPIIASIDDKIPNAAHVNRSMLNITVAVKNDTKRKSLFSVY